jgi:hypothetical protein
MEKWKETACHDSLCPLLHAASSLSAVSLLLPVSPSDGDSAYNQMNAPEERMGLAGRKRAVSGGKKGGTAEEWRPGIHAPTEEGRKVVAVSSAPIEEGRKAAAASSAAVEE